MTIRRSPFPVVRAAVRAPVGWGPRRRAWALGAALCTFAAVGIPTAVVPNPLFSREVPTTWWSYPVLAATATLGGLLLATYVRQPGSGDEPGDRRTGRLGTAGGLLSFLAVGCPVCNKLVLLALGTSGALSFWAPVQPFLAVVSLLLLAAATVRRLANETSCTVPA